MTRRVNFTARVQQIEAFTVTGGEDQFGWAATAFPVLGLEYGMVILRGHIFVHRNGCWGQVALEGKITGPAFAGDSEAREFALEHAPRLVEVTYGMARRALELNAVLLDVNFELPLLTPDTTLDIVEPDTVEGLLEKGVLAVPLRVITEEEPQDEGGMDPA